MPGSTEPRKREAILEAAFHAFSRYGFRRTSLEDIAREAGISRASIYTYFQNKEEVFRSVAGSLHEQSLGSAEAELKHAGDLASRVEAALFARIGPFQEVVTGSAHGGEIYDESNRLCGDVAAASSRRFERLLATALRAAARNGEIDLAASGLSAAAAAELLRLGAVGLKPGAPDVATFRRRLRGFVRVFFRGLR
ncbi:MAG: helix-turn-helix domain-containing protein [Myxococcota bacterium]|nr:helix-turn-helix domain-containing protein [Myxococcota bacterium]